MPKTLQKRLTISTLSVERRLISISEQKGGWIIIALKDSITFGDTNGQLEYGPTSEKGIYDIGNHKYSVHLTPNDPEGSTIHHTAELKGRPPVETYYWTKVFRQKQKYAFLGAARYPFYYKNSLKVPSPKRSIGSYDPEMFSLIYAILVSHPDVPDINSGADYNAISIDFNKVKVIFIWSYALVPAGGGAKTHLQTFPTEQISDPAHILTNSMFMEGFTESEVLNMFSYLRDDLREQRISQISYGASDLENVSEARETARLRYFKYGHAEGPEWNKFVEDCGPRRLISVVRGLT